MSKSVPAEAIVVDEITVDGKNVQLQNVDLPIHTIELDPDNPRIAHTIEFVAGAEKDAQKRIGELLWSDGDVRDLMRQVEINGGLIERIIVREESRRIVEGNCRTVAYRKLAEKHPNDPRWKKIPARLLPRGIGGRDVAILLGEMHVAGKNKWTAFEKAGHIHKLYKDYALTQEEIAQRLRMSKSKVNQSIKAFEAMRGKLLPSYPGAATVRKFSHLEEFYKKAELRDWAASRTDAVDLLVKWIGTDKLKRGVQVRELPAIVASDEAIDALTNDGFEAALKVVSDDDPTLGSKLFKQMKEMTDALRTARLDDIDRVRKRRGASSARQIVADLSDALRRFRELAGVVAQQEE
jgi:hypothetical protein